MQESFPDEKILRQLRASPAAMLVLLNKVDLLGDGSPLTKERRAAIGTEEVLIERWRTEFPGASVLSLSARQGRGLDAVMERLMAVLPEHPPFFPKDQASAPPPSPLRHPGRRCVPP